MLAVTMVALLTACGSNESVPSATSAPQPQAPATAGLPFTIINDGVIDAGLEHRRKPRP